MGKPDVNGPGKLGPAAGRFRAYLRLLETAKGLFTRSLAPGEYRNPAAGLHRFRSRPAGGLK